jgi:hypothetical protein
VVIRAETLVRDAGTALGQGRVAAARADADAAARWQPWASVPLLLRARADLLLGRAGEARAAAQAAVRADPNDPEALLALASLSTGAPSAALQALARRLDPLGDARGP